MRQLGADVSRETRDQLEALVNTLVRWQKAINLVGRTTIEGIWVRHVLDSAQLAILIPERASAFLGEAGRRMGLKKQPKIVVGRIEAVSPTKADVVTARALAPLGQLLEWARPHRTDTAICLFHKGKEWQAELTEAMKDWDIPGKPFNSVTDLDAVILRIGAYTAKGVRDRQSKGRGRKDHDGD
ncbi:MAG: 16S rRNA (guanine(527)-N(7))-methyltransferase RsmG [Alphaproteobacteria bacterium]|nr:16S rRNA (guanine(527)-N(7))-methyltransferase RsmG [Alphaproteobacteria bacterium]